MKTIFITGITGFVGTNLVSAFSASREFRILGHSRDKEKAKLLFQQADVTIVDEFSPALLNEYHVDCVIHLAGIAHDLSNQYSPQDYYDVNYGKTKELYEAFLNSKATRFVFLSSIKAAVDTSSTPVTEDWEPTPVTHYGKSKLLAEQFIQEQPRSSEKQFYLLRPCMIHGPGNKGNLNLLYRFVQAGFPYPLAAFANQRSFLSIENLAFTIHAMIQTEVPSGIYHVADEGFLSTQELFELITTAVGRKSRVWTLPKTMIQMLAAITGNRSRLTKLTESLPVSNRKLLTTLNCKLPVGIKEGLIKTIKSFRE
jgi:nucleoside-diphosphate-sugar epimerase